jgi:hypothetical protein
MKFSIRTSRTASNFFLAALSVWVLAAMTAQAHPGHGLHEAGLTHLLTSFDHVMTLALSGVVLWGIARFVQARKPRLALQVVGALTLAVSALIWFVRA